MARLPRNGSLLSHFWPKWRAQMFDLRCELLSAREEDSNGANNIKFQGQRVAPMQMHWRTQMAFLECTKAHLNGYTVVADWIGFYSQRASKRTFQNPLVNFKAALSRHNCFSRATK